LKILVLQPIRFAFSSVEVSSDETLTYNSSKPQNSLELPLYENLNYTSSQDNLPNYNEMFNNK
jgi:hypothetical protein